MVLDADDRAFVFPAHVWTPHFSVFGSFSAFASFEECYGDLAKHVFAAETGLSSDPPMNWRVKALDGVTLVSNSDAHSPQKLAREANILDCKLTFDAVRKAIKTRKGFLGTIEFFPEEGKYHLDGHRKCSVRMTPEETAKAGGICPVCGKKVTLGVMHRVNVLASRKPGKRPESALPFESLVPLNEIVGEVIGRGSATKGVAKICSTLYESLGSELFILREAAAQDIAKSCGDAPGELIAEGIRRVRAGKVVIEAGYDGEYGRVRLFIKDKRAKSRIRN
jgi:uncharacterized protein (TIGR00375 family)